MMNDSTGRTIDLKSHISQSIKNILFTRIGTRLMREDYGSLLPDLIDMPMTPQVVMLCRQATVSALATWEPRIKIEKISFDADSAAQGRLKITLQAAIISSGVSETFEIEKV